MTTLKIKDGDGATKYLLTGGVGTVGDPFIPIQDVNIQDQHSPVLIVPFHDTAATTALTASVAIDGMIFSVVSATGFTVGEYLTVYNEAGGRWYQGRIISISALDITVDTPIDFPYQSGDSISAGSTHLNVDGSVTPQVFSIRAPDPGIPIVGDITRLIFILETATDPDWPDFGDLAALTNGIVLRKTDGTYHNIFNIKSNAEIAAIMYDFEKIDKIAQLGTYGLKGRLTFGGQNKIGVVVRLDIDEDLELIIQDDLTSLLDFRVIAEGHVVV